MYSEQLWTDDAARHEVMGDLSVRSKTYRLAGRLDRDHLVGQLLAGRRLSPLSRARAAAFGLSAWKPIVPARRAAGARLIRSECVGFGAAPPCASASRVSS